MSESLQAKAARLEMARLSHEAFQNYAEQNRGGQLKLILAAGGDYVDGWFCTDIIPDEGNTIHYCDITRNFTFPPDTFDFIYCEHGIEHVAFEDGLNCLSECWRVLKKGGVLRLATPSLDKWINYYTVESEEHRRMTGVATHVWLKTAASRRLYSKCLVFNNAMRNWDHKMLYDADTLGAMLTMLQFTDITTAEIGESGHPELRNMEHHGRNDVDPLQEYNKMELMVLEARK